MAEDNAAPQANPELNSRQQGMLRDMAQTKLDIQRTAASRGMADPERQALLSKQVADYRAQRGLLAHDLMESHALAAGVSQAHLDSIKGAQDASDTLRRIAADPNMGEREKHAAIDWAHDDLLRKIDQVQSAPTSESRLESLARTPGRMVDAATGAVARVGGKIEQAGARVADKVQDLPGSLRPEAGSLGADLADHLSDHLDALSTVPKAVLDRVKSLNSPDPSAGAQPAQPAETPEPFMF